MSQPELAAAAPDDSAPGDGAAPPATPSRRRRLLIAAACLVSLASLLLAALLSEADKLRGAVWPQAPWLLLVTAATLASCYLLRGWRLSAVLGRPPSTGLTQVSILNNLLNALLPAKIGELSLPLLLKRYDGYGLTHGVGVLLLLRALDLLGLLGWCSLILLLSPGTWGPRGTALGLAGLAAITAACLILVLFRNHFRRPEAEPIRPGHRGKLIRAWRDLGAALGELSDRGLAGSFFLSLLVWLAIIASFHSAAMAFGVTASPATTTIATAAAAMAIMLPVNGIASFGPPQLAWAGVMASQAYSWEVNLVAATAVQVLALLVMGTLALALMLLRAWRGAATGDARL